MLTCHLQAYMQHRHQTRDGQFPRARRHTFVFQCQWDLQCFDNFMQYIAIDDSCLARRLLIQFDGDIQGFLTERYVVHADPFNR